jgi:DNA polymerase-1
VSLPELDPGTPVAPVVVPGRGLALRWATGSTTVPTSNPLAALAELEAVRPRWVWWRARDTAVEWVAGGLRPRSCWDLGAVARLLHGLDRDDPGAVWAAAHGLALPDAADGALTLLDLEGEGTEPVRPDGQLSREWLRGSWGEDLDSALRWAELALGTHDRQTRRLAELPDRRPVPGTPSLPYLTALSESMAALLAVELEHDGLAVDRTVLDAFLTATIGPRPLTDSDEVATRRARDERVWRHFGGDPIDLRNPATVRDLLARHGIDVPDTRSWRLEAYAADSPGVAALLTWRKVERIATTYGWSWAERDIGPDDRLRGQWSAAEGAGRMTASAGLHNMPAELRPAIRPPSGRVLVRADLGQVEPRVLAVVSGDAGLARAAGEDDLYAPVAAALRSDRPTAKVAVLAAMYGQTSGPAGEALRDMDRAYPVAMAYLRDAEAHGRRGQDLRTYGGRLLRLSSLTEALERAGGPDSTLAHSYGRFARNAMVQGAAAELFKAWAATVRAGLAGSDARIVLCLHDELLVECAQADADRVSQVVVDGLASTAAWWAGGSHVRFVADVAVVEDWAQSH